MILLYVTVCVLLGSSAGLHHDEVCYGRSYTIPSYYSPPLFREQLYFTPSNGGSSRLVMDNGKAKHPRLKVSTTSAVLTDLTEKDDGIFSISYYDDTLHNVIKLKILDCAKKETRYYRERFSYSIPREAAFLEFTPLGSEDQPKVLWNRTDPQINEGGRVEVKGNVWEIMNVNQGDMGHYSYRGKDKALLSRMLLTVQEQLRHYDAKHDGELLIKKPPGDVPWTVTFTSKGELEGYTLVKAGRLIEEDDWNSPLWNFRGRTEVTNDGIEINPVKSTDAGIYEFRDPQGHLAQTANVVVNIELVPPMIYVIAVGVLVAVIVCCCCVKKCWSKRSSAKRAKSTQQAAATLSAYCHDSNQSGGRIFYAAPAPDYSHQPLNSLVSREPISASPEPSVYNPVNIHVSSPQREVDPLGRQGDNPAPSLGSDCLSSDPEPRFDLKGLPSSPPLSSDSSVCDVYTSNKLNFL